MKKKENKHVQKEKALWLELEQYEKSGCMICLNGRPSAPKRIVSECLREDGSYMRDFVSDDEQFVKKIDFVRVKEEK